MSPTSYDEWLGRTTRPRTRQPRPGSTSPHATRRVLRVAGTTIGLLVAAVTLGGPASATWSVVGTDPATGQVGAAVASCTDARDLTTSMALVPKVGGAVSLGATSDSGPLLLASALRAGKSPRVVTDTALAADSATAAASRQYAVAVAGSRPTVATGADVGGTTGARVSTDGSATIQGNHVASPAVLDATRRAFDSTTGPFAARLLAGLNAGAAAGGDKACGGQARAASVVVLGANSAVFVPAATPAPSTNTSDLLGATNLSSAELAAQLAQRAVRPAPRGAHAPTVYLSSVTAPGSNALSVIDDRYASIVAAEAGRASGTNAQVIDPDYSQGLTLVALILFGVVGLAIAVLIIAGLRRADRNAAPDDEDEPLPKQSLFTGEVAALFDVDLAATIRRKREAERRREAGRRRDRESVWSGSTW